jgi:hypothetical protein
MNYILLLLLVIAFTSLVGVRFAPRTGQKRYIWLVCCLINLGTTIIFAIRTYKSNEEVRHLRADIAHTQVQLEPDSLEYDKMLVVGELSGLSAHIRFRSRKDQPFGTLFFTVRTPVGQTARITGIYADGMYQLGGKGIENDGTVAWICFAPATMTTIPTLVVKVTTSTPLRVEGDRLKKPVVLEVRKDRKSEG